MPRGPQRPNRSGYAVELGNDAPERPEPVALPDAFILIAPCHPEVMSDALDGRRHVLFERRSERLALRQPDHLFARDSHRSTGEGVISNRGQHLPPRQQINETPGIAFFEFPQGG